MCHQTIHSWDASNVTPARFCLNHCHMCLCSIRHTDPEAVAGGYYRWSTSLDYLDAYQMQLDTGALMNGTCLNATDTYEMVQCPAGSYKLPVDKIAGLCAERGLPCPPVSLTVLLDLLHPVMPCCQAAGTVCLDLVIPCCESCRCCLSSCMKC